MRRVITLLTDFGNDGPYVGEVRGVLVSLAPGARLVDISHEVPRHDVLAGAFVLAAAAGRFPRGTIHVAVVDPGVGGPRRAIAVDCGGHLLVGPDNGLLTLAARRLGAPRTRGLDAAALGLAEPHPTFHGRDLFAPAAARLAAGLPFDAIGEAVDDVVTLDVETPRSRDDGSVQLRVLFVDRFGNVTTNLASADEARLPGPPPWEVDGPAGRLRADRARTYGEAAPGRLVLLPGSSGWLELAIDRQSAAARLGARAGDPVLVSAAARG